MGGTAQEGRRGDGRALASLWQRRLYGLEIIRYLETHSQLALAEGTIYPVLNRLKVEGLLTSEWVEAEAGHPRKYYSLTEAGQCTPARYGAGVDQLCRGPEPPA
jgi:DNA-binding PadR family transcriptional regulator